MSYTNYEELQIWQLSFRLCKDIYQIFTPISLKNDYGLLDQIRRSAVSIPSNISEGFERDSDKELIRFLRFSKGSVAELKTQVKLSNEIGYISKQQTNNILGDLESLGKQIGGFIKYLKNSVSV